MRRVCNLVLATAVAAVVASTGAVAAQETGAPSSLAPAVNVVRAAEREIVEKTTVTGTLVPRQEVLVSPEVEGLRVTDVLVEEGDRVEAGQVLARLSRDLLETSLSQNAAALARADAGIAQAQSQIVQAEAAQVEAAKALERTQALMKTGNSTEAQLEQRVSAARAAGGRLAAARGGLSVAEADHRTAEAQRDEIQLKLARTEIRAPLPGIISRKSARIGATAGAAAEALFRIIANGEIELEAEVTDSQLAGIHEGEPAQVAVAPGRSVQGEVRNVFPEVDRATRLGRVRISLPPDAALRIGAFARGEIELARRKGVAVPAGSIIYGASGPVVQIVVDDKVQARRVRTGLSGEGYLQIEAGVAPGDLVVARAGSFLRDGDIVRPVLSETAQAGEKPPEKR
jgi:RND family efflux transporter MFP subunit